MLYLLFAIPFAIMAGVITSTVGACVLLYRQLGAMKDACLNSLFGSSILTVAFTLAFPFCSFAAFLSDNDVDDHIPSWFVVIVSCFFGQPIGYLLLTEDFPPAEVWESAAIGTAVVTGAVAVFVLLGWAGVFVLHRVASEKSIQATKHGKEAPGKHHVVVEQPNGHVVIAIQESY